MENINERPEFINATESIYKSFEHEIECLREGPASKKTDIILSQVVTSAYVKSYDFVRYICKLNDLKDAFFQLPMLRGMCEDLIVLNYLLAQKKERQNYLYVVKQFEELKQATKAQKDFLSSYNKGQILPPVLNEGDINLVLKEHEDAGNKFEKASFPSVFKMAESTGYKDIYSFIYHASSKVVHFDIFTLLSMGWGKIDRNQGTMEANFSYRHDYKHYYTFILFYSSYIFIQQTKSFKDYLNLPQIIDESLKPLITDYQEIDWPEIVTFNNLNITPPSSLLRKTFRFIQKNNE